MSLRYFLLWSFRSPGFSNNHNTAKKWFLVAVSYVFYAFFRADFTLILLASSVMNFALALWLGSLSGGLARKAVLWLGIALNLCILAAFKYYNFFVASTMNLGTERRLEHQHPVFRGRTADRDLVSDLSRAVLHHRCLPA